MYDVSGAASDRNCVVLSDIHIDIMDYIQPATCTDAEFRQMWAEFEWENKVSFIYCFHYQNNGADLILYVKRGGKEKPWGTWPKLAFLDKLSYRKMTALRKRYSVLMKGWVGFFFKKANFCLKQFVKFFSCIRSFRHTRNIW